MSGSFRTCIRTYIHIYYGGQRLIYYQYIRKAKPQRSRSRGKPLEDLRDAVVDAARDTIHDGVPRTDEEAYRKMQEDDEFKKEMLRERKEAEAFYNYCVTIGLTKRRVISDSVEKDNTKTIQGLLNRFWRKFGKQDVMETYFRFGHTGRRKLKNPIFYFFMIISYKENSGKYRDQFSKDVRFYNTKKNVGIINMFFDDDGCHSYKIQRYLENSGWVVDDSKIYYKDPVSQSWFTIDYVEDALIPGKKDELKDVERSWRKFHREFKKRKTSNSLYLLKMACFSQFLSFSCVIPLVMLKILLNHAFLAVFWHLLKNCQSIINLLFSLIN